MSTVMHKSLEQPILQPVIIQENAGVLPAPAVSSPVVVAITSKSAPEP